jgi:hypothetical protein
MKSGSIIFLCANIKNREAGFQRLGLELNLALTKAKRIYGSKIMQEP